MKTVYRCQWGSDVWGSRIQLEAGFELRDLWVGVFWKRERFLGWCRTDVYVCPLPAVVLHLQIDQPKLESRARPTATDYGHTILVPEVREEPWLRN